MRIGAFLSQREHIINFTSLYKALVSRGYKILIFDIEEEKGWFEKGIQYVSLNYDKPMDIIKMENSLTDFYRLFQDIIEKRRLDIILFTGYTDTLFTLAYAAKSMDTPVVHIGSGLRTYDIGNDMEILRQLIDHTVSYHLTYLPEHTYNLLREEINPKYIKLIGYPVIELVNEMLSQALDKSTILKEIDIEPGKYVSVIIGNRFTLNHIDQLKDFSMRSREFLVLPLSKNYKKFLMEKNKYYELMSEFDMLFLELLDYYDHLSFLYNSRAIITDLEWVALEGVTLKKPVTLISDPNNPPTLLKRNFVNIIQLDDEFSKNLHKIYRRYRGFSAEEYYGGSNTSDIFIDSMNVFMKMKPSYPQPTLYTSDESGLKKISGVHIPKKYMEVMELE